MLSERLTMKIQMQLSVPSINNAIRQLQAYNTKKMLDNACRKLGEIGTEIVSGYFSICKVYGKQVDDGYVIIAEGPQVMFIEFGTGQFTDSEYGRSLGLTIVEPGMWSQTEGQGQYTPEHPYWTWGGKVIKGTPARRGFYFASKQLREMAASIVREEFRKHYDRH